MKKVIANRMNMYAVVLATCKQHEGEWAGIPKMVSAIDDLENAINVLNSKALLHGVKTIGVASSKAILLDRLYSGLEQVHGAYRMLAIELEDEQLKKRNSFRLSSLHRMNAAELKAHIAFVAESLIETGAQLEPFGIDNNRVGEILQLIEESSIALSKPRLAIVERKNLTKAMDYQVDLIDKIVKERVDVFVRMIKSSSPDFFNEYFAARKVINSGVRHQANPTNTAEGFDSGTVSSVPNEPDDGN